MGEEAATPGSPAACIIARLAEVADLPVAAFFLFWIFLCDGLRAGCTIWDDAEAFAIGIVSPAVLMTEAARLCAQRPLLATTWDAWGHGTQMQNDLCRAM